MRAIMATVLLAGVLVCGGCDIGDDDDGAEAATCAPLGELFRLVRVTTTNTCFPEHVGETYAPDFLIMTVLESAPDSLIVEGESGSQSVWKWDAVACHAYTERPINEGTMTGTQSGSFYFGDDLSVEGKRTLNVVFAMSDGSSMPCISVQSVVGGVQ